MRRGHEHVFIDMRVGVLATPATIAILYPREATFDNGPQIFLDLVIQTHQLLYVNLSFWRLQSHTDCLLHTKLELTYGWFRGGPEAVMTDEKIVNGFQDLINIGRLFLSITLRLYI